MTSKKIEERIKTAFALRERIDYFNNMYAQMDFLEGDYKNLPPQDIEVIKDRTEKKISFVVETLVKLFTDLTKSELTEFIKSPQGREIFDWYSELVKDSNYI